MTFRQPLSERIFAVKIFFLPFYLFNDFDFLKG